MEHPINVADEHLSEAIETSFHRLMPFIRFIFTNPLTMKQNQKQTAFFALFSGLRYLCTTKKYRYDEFC
jgi:hypothetical protein